jgi:hypothetical protein
MTSKAEFNASLDTADILKVCTKCGLEQSIKEYRLRDGKPNAQCRTCVNERSAAYKRKKRAEKRAKKIASGELVLLPEPTTEGNKVCKYCKEEKPLKMFRPKRLKCLDCERADGRAYRKSEHGKTKSKTWVEDNREKMYELQAGWHLKNKDKINAKNKERYHSDPVYRKRRNNKNTTYSAMFEFKHSKYVDCLGCTANLFRMWINFCLEKADKFTLDNYAEEWHFDHVIPINLFNLLDPKEEKICYNWRNVMPYGSKDNLTKNKYVDPEQISSHYDNLIEFHKLHKLEFTKEYEELYAKHLIYAGNPLEP